MVTGHRRAMLTLSLLRHAKSSWDNPALDDFDRPLASRGQKAAPLIGSALAERGLRPDLIICSGAARARQTLALVLEKLGSPTPEVVFDDGIYLAPPELLLARLRAIKKGARGETPKHVMLVGHNPGMEELALMLAGSGPAHDRARMAAKFPTAAVAVFTFDADTWKAVKPGTGRLEHFLSPRQLT
jgi:phosphohistidine phosphatase